LKQIAWSSLNADLDRHIEEANNYLASQKQAFVALESYKISSHVDLIHNYTKEIKSEQALDSQNKDLFNKINVLENDMQDQIVSWKHKHANIKEHNENEISDLNKK
jgi:hypothetical protein